ncbi:MAG: hypothetical protein AB4062_15095 [Crocosphaera sp.]
MTNKKVHQNQEKNIEYMELSDLELESVSGGKGGGDFKRNGSSGTYYPGGGNHGVHGGHENGSYYGGYSYRW